MSIQELKIPTPFVPMRVSSRSRARSLLVGAPIAFVGLFFLYLLIRSRHWEYDHDTPLLQYCGLLMHRYGWMPYRDFFSFYTPGGYYLYAALFKMFGTVEGAPDSSMTINEVVYGLSRDYP